MIKSLILIFRDSPNSFEGQKADEKVILLLRRHPFIILIRIAFFGFACLVPIIVGVMFFTVFKSNGWMNLFLFVSSIWYLGFWLAIFISLTMYTLNTMIITDSRIIEREQHGLFDQVVSELHSHRIQDVSVHTSGFIETFLRFGDITVQTAGSEKQFVFHKIPNPDDAKDVIMRIASSRDSGIKATATAEQAVNSDDV